MIVEGGLDSAVRVIVAEVGRLLTVRGVPIVIALDGGSGAGKSTLSVSLANSLGAALVQTDDFFAADITDGEWDARPPESRAGGAIDWRRLRAEALEPLRAGRPARWRAFDFASGPHPDGTYALRPDYVEREPAPVVVLDGAYSTRPELADLIDLAVLVDVPVGVRHERLGAREEANFLKHWHGRWDAAEEYHLTRVRPASAFDLVVRLI
jgi:uridine kinase